MHHATHSAPVASRPPSPNSAGMDLVHERGCATDVDVVESGADGMSLTGRETVPLLESHRGGTAACISRVHPGRAESRSI